MNRGGSWNNDANNVYVGNRNANNPYNENNNLGFRLVSTGALTRVRVSLYILYSAPNAIAFNEY